MKILTMLLGFFIASLCNLFGHTLVRKGVNDDIKVFVVWGFVLQISSLIEAILVIFFLDPLGVFH